MRTRAEKLAAFAMLHGQRVNIVEMTQIVQQALDEQVAETIEKAAKVAEAVSLKLHEERGRAYGYNDALKMSDGAQMAADEIRTIAPATTEPK